jgi:Ni/Co efflux regulator RcnB
VVAQQPAPDRGNWQGRGERGNWQNRADWRGQQQAAAPQPMDQNRGNWQGRGDRGNWQNRADWHGQQQATGPQPMQDRGRWQGYNGYRGYDRFPSRPGNASFSGPRRDFSGFRDFHRDWRSNQRFRMGFYHRPSGWYPHHWTFGEFLPQPYWVSDYWLADYMDYDLPPPPYGAVWVRVDEDALLIDRYSGEIITVVYNVFY